MGVLGIYQNNQKVKLVSFPKTKPGETSNIQVKIINEANHFCQIESISVLNSEVKIDSSPTWLEPKQSGIVSLTWNPIRDTIIPLKTKIIFNEVVG